jgi:V8-like Glu-specific endopeptidase
VVRSPGRNKLIIAAHCAFDADSGQPLDDLVFAPGYRNGDEPAGLWKVGKVVVDDRWATSQDEDLDVAFLVLDQKAGDDIQDVLGGSTLAHAALHRIVFTRPRVDPRTQDYYERRVKEGRTRREIVRCL